MIKNILDYCTFFVIHRLEQLPYRQGPFPAHAGEAREGFDRCGGCHALEGGEEGRDFKWKDSVGRNLTEDRTWNMTMENG